jgi:hypothetical protein
MTGCGEDRSWLSQANPKSLMALFCEDQRDGQMVGEAGIEPTTTGLEGRCSIQLSYSPVAVIVTSPATASKLQQGNFHNHGEGEFERVAPALFRAVCRPSASLDKPCNSKTRHSLHLRRPQDQLPPRRLCRSGT